MPGKAFVGCAAPEGLVLRMFRKKFAQGWFYRLWARLTCRRSSLLDLDKVIQRSRIVGSHYAGIKTVDIDHIRGTLGKAGEFDAEFHPIREISCWRWMDIAREKLSGRNLPPVELVRVDDVYYVRDGHHRISVARAMGQLFIEAEVVILRLR
jgi:hypothetical protein